MTPEQHHSGAARQPHVVVIASANRRDVLTETLEALSRQTSLPELVLLALASPSDCDPICSTPFPVITRIAPRGLTRQLNAPLREIASQDAFVSVFDDDVELHPTYLRAAREFLTSRPEVALMSGEHLADGGVTRAEARQLLAAAHLRPAFRSSRTAYGCNLNFRSALCRSVLFDENLPLYGWLCDADFSIRSHSVGQVVCYSGCAFVHLAVSSGRMSQRRFGYSQIANPLYLRHKGTLGGWECYLRLVGKGLLANIAGCLTRDRQVDRPSRLAGNLIALHHAIVGKADPSYIESMK